MANIAHTTTSQKITIKRVALSFKNKLVTITNDGITNIVSKNQAIPLSHSKDISSVTDPVCNAQYSCKVGTTLSIKTIVRITNTILAIDESLITLFFLLIHI